MNLVIKPTEKGMGQVFADFFQKLDFAHEPHFSTCYCRFYHLDCELDEWQNLDPEENRIGAKEAIDDGSMFGFLAFDGDKCVGWLNANKAESYPRLTPYVGPYVEGKKVAVSICFVIHPEYRNQGIATALLEAAVNYYQEQGYDAIMSMPIQDDFSEKQYRGTVTMYEKLGFENIRSIEQVRVMWKDY